MNLIPATLKVSIFIAITGNLMPKYIVEDTYAISWKLLLEKITTKDPSENLYPFMVHIQISC